MSFITVLSTWQNDFPCTFYYKIITLMASFTLKVRTVVKVNCAEIAYK